MRAALYLICGLMLPAFAVPAFAQKLPDLKNQPAWGEKEKQDFLKYLRSSQQAPISGQVKDVAPVKGEPGRLRKARYLTLSLEGDSMFIRSAEGGLHNGSVALGAKALAGGHLTSWIRYYGGIKFDRLHQEKLDGTTAHLAHYEIPAGIELALIPLGTPQTRYVLMRAGLSYHYIKGPVSKSDFDTSLLGWNGAWNAGLGYEWQFDNSNWRANVLAEGYKSFAGGGNPRFYGLGVTAGLAYTF